MNHQFHFKNFEAPFKLRFQANVVLNRILDVAPYGAIGFGLLEKQDGDCYRCTLDIHSKDGPFMASAVKSTPVQALEEVEAKIRRQLDWWKSHRGGPLPPAMVATRIPARAVS